MVAAELPPCYDTSTEGTWPNIPNALHAFALSARAKAGVRLVICTAPERTPMWWEITVRSGDPRRSVLSRIDENASFIGKMGRTFFYDDQSLVVVFINSDRIPSDLIYLNTAHELGHVLTRGKGFNIARPLQSAAPSEDAVVIETAADFVQHAIIEDELRSAGFDTRPLLEFQLRQAETAIAAGFEAVFPGIPRYIKRILVATQLAYLARDLPLEGRSRAALFAAFPSDISSLARRLLQTVPKAPRSIRDYESQVTQTASLFGLPKARWVFVPRR